MRYQPAAYTIVEQNGFYYIKGIGEGEGLVSISYRSLKEAEKALIEKCAYRNNKPKIIAQYDKTGNRI